MNALKSFLEHARAALFYSVSLDRQACIGCQICYAVCPVGCFRPSETDDGIVLCRPELCIACGACQLQCPSRAAQLLPKNLT
jgi:NAD-dependent dihydropyrimidine dehydrogenase PreA subunit